MASGNPKLPHSTAEATVDASSGALHIVKSVTDAIFFMFFCSLVKLDDSGHPFLLPLFLKGMRPWIVSFDTSSNVFKHVPITTMGLRWHLRLEDILNLFVTHFWHFQKLFVFHSRFRIWLLTMCLGYCHELRSFDLWS